MQPTNPQKTPQPGQTNLQADNKKEQPSLQPVRQGFHPEDSIVVSPLRTYDDDIKHAIESDNVSMVKIAMAEAKRQETVAKEEEDINPQSNKNVKLITISFLLLVLGVGAIVGLWYWKMNQAATPAPVVMHRSSLIPYDEEAPIQLVRNERQELLTGVENSLLKKYEDDTVLVFLPVMRQVGTSTETLSTDSLLSLLGSRASGALVRAFGKDPMLGLFRKDRIASPFLLLRSTSFDQVYSGTLEWETSIPDDIGDLFYTKEELLDGSTSTVAIADSLSFKDEVVGNRDVRALRTKSGHLLMYYSFINDKLVLFARDFNAISEVAKRLATVQFTQ